MANIKQPVINTFNRVGFPYEAYDNGTKNTTVQNRFSGETVVTTELVAECINWVYGIGERRVNEGTVKVSDFDRIRYFVLDQDNKAYSTCLD